MGQRSQIYIRIENPLKKEKVGGCIYSDKEKKEAELYFGKGKYSVIPFHHQWLYGTTFVGMMVKIMKEANLAEGEHHPFSSDLTNIPYDEDYRRGKLKGYGLIDFIETLISITDFEVSKIGGRFGVERLLYIGDEHFDYEKGKVDKSWGNHQKRCDIGDNNDGILVVDIPSKKYCFMNPYTQYLGSDRASGLKELEPVSALDYQRAYYPTTKKGFSKDEENIEERLIENREMAKAIKEITKDFAVLSLDEVKKMFPATYKELENKKAREAAAKK